MEEVEFKSCKTGTLLRGRFIKAEVRNNQSPVVIMVTGDGPKGSKSLSWVNMPPKLKEIGIASFIFDFEGLGFSGGERKSLSLSVGIDNFRTAFEFVCKQTWIDKKRIGVFASSFGATVLLMTPDIANKLKAIGFKSPAAFLADAYYREVGEAKFDIWRRNKYLEDNGYSFEVFIDALTHNAYISALQITTPCLITQGDKDEIIPLRHTKYLYECLKTRDKHLEVFEGVDHGYSKGDSWERMADKFVDWFKSKLLDNC